MIIKATTITNRTAFINTVYIEDVVECDKDKGYDILKISYTGSPRAVLVKGAVQDYEMLICPEGGKNKCLELKFSEPVKKVDELENHPTLSKEQLQALEERNKK